MRLLKRLKNAVLGDFYKHNPGLERFRPCFESVGLEAVDVEMLFGHYCRHFSAGPHDRIRRAELLRHLRLQDNVFAQAAFAGADHAFPEFGVLVGRFLSADRAALVRLFFDAYARRPPAAKRPRALGAEEVGAMLGDWSAPGHGGDRLSEELREGLRALAASNEGGEEEVPFDKFLEFVRHHELLLLPAYNLQLQLGERILGSGFWRKAGKRRRQHSKVLLPSAVGSLSAAAAAADADTAKGAPGGVRGKAFPRAAAATVVPAAAAAAPMAGGGGARRPPRGGSAAAAAAHRNIAERQVERTHLPGMDSDSAATTIQRTERGRQARRRVIVLRAQHTAATKIQTKERQIQAKAKVHNIRERRRQENTAATTIQTKERQNQAKAQVHRIRQEHRRRNKAATTIQTKERQIQAKRRVVHLRAERAKARVEQAKARSHRPGGGTPPGGRGGHCSSSGGGGGREEEGLFFERRQA